MARAKRSTNHIFFDRSPGSPAEGVSVAAAPVAMAG